MVIARGFGPGLMFLLGRKYEKGCERRKSIACPNNPAMCR
jgi:hypothetical protein